jgi:hypothetical protein
MTFFGMALLTAVKTVVLAAFAVFTAWYARKAFREQSREVRKALLRWSIAGGGRLIQ